MSSRKRPAKRNLVRWSDDLDKGVLLAIQYASAESGIKLPFAGIGTRVAEIMGPKFTEGSIVQHLAKLRSIMEAEGIPVPPPLRRGMVTKVPSKVYPNASPKGNYEPLSPMYTGSPESPKDFSLYDRTKTEYSDEEDEETPKKKAKVPAKSFRRGMSDDEEDDQEYDSNDGSVITPKKNTRRPKATPSSRARASRGKKALQGHPSTPSKQVIKTERSDEPNMGAITDETAGPARRTRGIKRDYSAMEATPSNDEAEVDDSTAEVEDAAMEGGGEGGLSSEGETEILEQNIKASDDVATDVANLPSVSDFTSPYPVANLPYGQIHMVDGFGANPNNADASMFSANQGFIGIHGLPSYGGSFGMGGLYGTGQFPFGSFPLMNPTPDPYYAAGGMAGTVTPSGESLLGSSRNDSVATGMSVSSNPSPSDNEAVSSRPVSHNFATELPQSGTADVIGNHDMTASMPSDDIVWDDNLVTGYLNDDA